MEMAITQCEAPHLLMHHAAYCVAVSDETRFDVRATNRLEHTRLPTNKMDGISYRVGVFARTWRRHVAARRVLFALSRHHTEHAACMCSGEN
ncbi:protein of unknown function [Paraburkholderia kururiensis]